MSFGIEERGSEMSGTGANHAKWRVMRKKTNIKRFRSFENPEFYMDK